MNRISDEIRDTLSTKTFAEASDETTTTTTIAGLIEEQPVYESWIEPKMEDLENDPTIESVNRMDVSVE